MQHHEMVSLYCTKNSCFYLFETWSRPKRCLCCVIPLQRPSESGSGGGTGLLLSRVLNSLACSRVLCLFSSANSDLSTATFSSPVLSSRQMQAEGSLQAKNPHPILQTLCSLYTFLLNLRGGCLSVPVYAKQCNPCGGVTPEVDVLSGHRHLTSLCCSLQYSVMRVGL